MHATKSLIELSVLLVEPSSMQTHLVKQMLSKQGIKTVHHVETAADALAFLKTSHPDLVISSYYLKDISGAELVMTLRDHESTADLPFVLISSESRPQMLEPIRQSGACFILAKPFTEMQFAVALQSVMDYLNPEIEFEIPDVESLRVLVVDDSISARRHIQRLLGDMGIEHIIEAEDGLQATKILAETMVDLVLTDYNMPEMDGRALTEYIRTQSWQNDVPVMMITSEQNMGRLAAVERAGVSAICDKPFDARSIHRIIAEALKDR